jgi:Alkylmercury lyase
VTGVDGRVRLAILERFAARGEAPSAADVATAIGEDADTVAQACSRLADDHVLVLRPGTGEIWMAHPFSAVPTGFRVVTDRGSSYGNCIWDALGIPAMLAADARIETTCPDCGEPLELRVRDGDLEPLDWVAHFAVPAARWWDDIGHT